MKIAYEWLPDTEHAWGERVALGEALQQMARAMEDIAIRLDCQACKRELFRHVADYERWARELGDGRRRKVPMLPASVTVQKWRDQGRPFLVCGLAEAERGGQR